MTACEAAILGVLQGLTEFLPVSSSGHLTIGQALLGFREPDVFFDVVLHIGTLLAVLIYFKDDITTILKDAASPRLPGTNWFSPVNWGKGSGRGMLLLLVLGSVPTALIGFFGKDLFEAAFGSLRVVGAMLLVTALFLSATYFARERAKGDLGPLRALLVGAVQGLAILPGISRSGATISVAMIAGVRPDRAVRFSFLLSIPAILGALFLKLGDVEPAALELSELSLGFITSFTVGYASLWMLIGIVKRGGLHYFAAWCVPVGLVALFAG